MDRGIEVLPVSVVVPTYERGEILLATVRQLLQLRRRAKEIVLVDQTARHPSAVAAELGRLHSGNDIRWIRQPEPSTPRALNRGLAESGEPCVLFLDDDVKIGPEVIAAHATCYSDPCVWAVAGQILQPGQSEDNSVSVSRSMGVFRDLDFPFNSGFEAWIENGMAGNLSVRRDRALEVGGFDENFVPPVAYRFETEFCKRLCRAGGRIRFEPAARVWHLRAARGGTRSTGSHLTSGSPVHGVGDYYFALCQGWNWEVAKYILRRPLREVRTRFHLRHPWWIPVKLWGEMRALSWAVRLWKRGPKRIHAMEDNVRSERGPEREHA